MATTRTRVLTATAGAAALGVTIAWQYEVRRLTRLDRETDESYTVSHLAIELLDLRADRADVDLTDEWLPCTRLVVFDQVAAILDRHHPVIVETVTNDLGATAIMDERHENYRRITDRLLEGERILRNAGHRTQRVYR